MKSLGKSAFAALEMLAYQYLLYAQPKQAQIYFRLLAHFSPQNTRILLSYASSELLAGNPQEAIPVAKKVLRISKRHKDRAVAHLILCIAYFQIGGDEESEANISKFISERGHS